jgi:hypothetical protein
MPRRNTSSRSSSPPPPQPLSLPLPLPSAKHMNVKPFTQSDTPTLGTTLLQGISLGAGSSIGHKMVDILFGKSKNTNLENENEHVNRHRDLLKNYHECINHSNGTMEEKEQCAVTYLRP